MRLFVAGLNHNSAPIHIREKLYVSPDQYDQFNRLISPQDILTERTLISTCNRTEIYGVTLRPDECYEHLFQGMSAFSGLPSEHIRNHVYIMTDEKAAHHLFCVASGLESMVLGETEILGQVKEAYSLAQSKHWVSAVLNQLFQKGFQVAKKVRTETRVSSGKVSVGSVAVDLAERIFHQLSTKKIMLIGSGEVASLVCDAFMSRGFGHLIIANRNRPRAERLAQRVGALEIPFDEIDSRMPEVDVLIASAGSHHAFVGVHRVKRWMKTRKIGSLFMMDLGLPRNIEGEVAGIPDVYLYNLDDLKGIASENLSHRKKAVDDGRMLISDAATRFMLRMNTMSQENNGGE